MLFIAFLVLPYNNYHLGINGHSQFIIYFLRLRYITIFDLIYTLYLDHTSIFVILFIKNLFNLDFLIFIQ